MYNNTLFKLQHYRLINGADGRAADACHCTSMKQACTSHTGQWLPEGPHLDAETDYKILIRQLCNIKNHHMIISLHSYCLQGQLDSFTVLPVGGCSIPSLVSAYSSQSHGTT